MRVVYLYVRMKLGYDRHQEGSTFVAFSQSYEQRMDTPPQTKRTRIQLDGLEPTYALLCTTPIDVTTPIDGTVLAYCIGRN